MLRRHTPEWASIRSIGNSLPARISILMFLLGHLIIFNGFVSEKILSFQQTTGGIPSGLLPWPWKLYFLYLGLFCAGVASTLYQLLCGRVVKRYLDEDDFAFRAESTVTRADLKLYVSFIERVWLPDAYSAGLKLIRQRFENLSGAGIRDQDKILSIEILKMYYAAVSHRWLWGRLFSAAFYVFAFLLLAIPSFDTFVRVIRVIFSI